MATFILRLLTRFEVICNNLVGIFYLIYFKAMGTILTYIISFNVTFFVLENEILTSVHLSIHLTPLDKQKVTQGQFLSGVEHVWIQRFPSPKTVSIPGFKSAIYPTIYF